MSTQMELPITDYIPWSTFTRRTDDPKLAWIESQLDAWGISHRRQGESFHAPILQVPTSDLNRANEILFIETGHGTVDDMRDDHPYFTTG